MSKNLIYMVAVDHDTSTYKNSNYAKYAKLSWKFWCKKNNVDFIVIDKHHDRYKFPVWNKVFIPTTSIKRGDIAVFPSLRQGSHRSISPLVGCDTLPSDLFSFGRLVPSTSSIL